MENNYRETALVGLMVILWFGSSGSTNYCLFQGARLGNVVRVVNILCFGRFAVLGLTWLAFCSCHCECSGV